MTAPEQRHRSTRRDCIAFTVLLVAVVVGAALYMVFTVVPWDVIFS
jgi:hypothetical protein